MLSPSFLRAMPLKPPDEEGDKSVRGAVLVVGGCAQVPGAVLLAAQAALRAGAGRLQVATARSVAIPLGLAMPEALVHGLPETEEGCLPPGCASELEKRLERCTAALIGPGMSGEGASELTRNLLRLAPGGSRLVLDAGALDGLAEEPDLIRRHGGACVLTPHAREMARLLGIDHEAVKADPLAAARRAAAELGATVVMKGASSWIVAPDGRAVLNAHGHVGLATSGSGDCLAGILAGLLARGAEPVQAACWAVWMHAEAAHRLARRIGPLGFLARELLPEIPGIMAELG